MADEQKCPHCGKPAPVTALPGLCPECMLKAGLLSQTGEIGPDGNPLPGSGKEAPALEEIAPFFPQLEILECLGRGGMGAVYKARQPKLERFVALKILIHKRADGSSDAAFAERFQREARALAQLNHPNIVGVHDFGQAGPYDYLIMDYVDGLSLRQLLQRGKLRPEEALRLVPPVCEALQFAHEHGIVHRDIKPENILLDRQGRAKIADFGIAKILGRREQRLNLTAERQVIGTPHYMAPEQVEKPQQVDHRADIYSLGVVFYEMLTGELPLGKFPLPSRTTGVDTRLDEVVLRALEKEPARRYQQAGQVKTDLDTIALNKQSPGKEENMNRKLLWVFPIGAVCLLIAFLAWLALHQRKYTVSQVFPPGVSAPAQLNTIHIKGQLRVNDGDNFGAFDTDRDFTSIELWKQFEPQLKWRVEKPGRVAVMDGEVTLMHMKGINLAMKFKMASPSAFDTEWLHALARKASRPGDELNRLNAKGTEVVVTKERGADGQTKLSATFNTKSKNEMKNFLETADTRQVYTFDAQSKRLESVRIYSPGKSGDMLVFETTLIECDQPIDAEVFHYDLPADVSWYQEPQKLPDNEKYASISADEAARNFFEACASKDWTEAAKYTAIPFDERVRQGVGGLEIVSIGPSFSKKGYGGRFVPYDVKWATGGHQTNNLALRKDNAAGRWQVDGGF